MSICIVTNSVLLQLIVYASYFTILPNLFMIKSYYYNRMPTYQITLTALRVRSLESSKPIASDLQGLSQGYRQ